MPGEGLMSRLRLFKLGGAGERPVKSVAVAEMEPMGVDYPGNCHSDDPGRIAQIAARWFAVAFGISFAANLVQAGFQMVAVEDIRLEPLWLSADPKSDQVVTVQPARLGSDGLRLAERGWVKEFVLRRHTVIDDNKAMGANITWLRARMGDGPWTDMLQERGVINDAIAHNVTRTVSVSTVTWHSDGFYLVDFSYSDSQKGREIGNGVFRANIRFDYRKTDIRRGDLDNTADLTNPFGWTVMFYSVAPLTGSGGRQ